ncbi:MAG: hypothetical protein JO180_08925 [Gemmatirosa sp.]|nr:hypothetical protein [Gemmatirosa sp.]
MKLGASRGATQAPNVATARVDAELARARAEVARVQAEAARAAARADAQGAGEGSNTSVTTSPDGRTTTINENGKVTTITTDENGQVTIREGDKSTTISGPGSGAIARLAQQQAHNAVASFPPFIPEREQIPDGVVPLVGMIFSLIAATIIFFPIARAYARRMDRKTAATPAGGPDMSLRFDRIEQAIETMAVEVERVSEAQRYSAKLLTERLPEAPMRSVRAAESVR